MDLQPLPARFGRLECNPKHFTRKGIRWTHSNWSTASTASITFDLIINEYGSTTHQAGALHEPDKEHPVTSVRVNILTTNLEMSR
jgi:hypothetical protein